MTDSSSPRSGQPPVAGAEAPGEPPDCAGPDPSPHRPLLAIPPGACDCHAHVIGPRDRFPYVAARKYTPPEATPEAYLHLLDTLGLARGVLTQVSVHGTDNSRMLEVLRAHPDRLRGVAVVAPDITDTALDALAASGVRGVRFNLLYGGGAGLDALEPLAHRIGRLGWHVELLADPAILPGIVDRLENLPVEIVLDHMGHIPAAAGADSPAARAVQRLLRSGKGWVKLSAPYRLSDAGPPYADTIDLAASFADAGPDRCVWATDWPHPAFNGPVPKDGHLLDLLASWVPEPSARNCILVDNPAKLYGF